MRTVRYTPTTPSREHTSDTNEAYAQESMEDDRSMARRSTAIREDVRDTLALCRNCAQTSFFVLQREFDLEGGPILKALTPFPGLALRGETCGAVSGCLMALGSVYGRDRLDDWKGYIASLRPARRFCRRFEEAHGATSCADLLDAKLGRRFDLADRREALEYVAAGGPETCSSIIASAVQIAAEIIVEQRPHSEPRPSSGRRLRRTQADVRSLLTKAYVRLLRLRSELRARFAGSFR